MCYMQNNMNGNNCTPNNMMNNMNGMNNMNMNGMNNINQANNQQMNPMMGNQQMNPMMMNPQMNPMMMNPQMNPMMMNPQMNPMMNGMMMNMMANIYGVAQMQNIMMNNIQKMQQDYINQQNQAIQTNSNNNGTNNFNTPNNNNTTPNNNIITLIFVRTDKDKKEDFKITLLCSKSDTINQMIDKYCEKTFEEKENLLFLCNSENLGQYPNRTIDNAALLNNSMIMVVNKKDMYGGILVK